MVNSGYKKVGKKKKSIWRVLRLAHTLVQVQAAEEVIWAYDFRFSPEVFWYQIIFVLILISLKRRNLVPKNLC